MSEKDSRWTVEVERIVVDARHDVVPLPSTVELRHSLEVKVVSCAGIVVGTSVMEVEAEVVVTVWKRVSVGIGVHAINSSQGRGSREEGGL